MIGLGKYIQDSKSATKQAFNEAMDAVGIETDPDLKLYKSLTPEDYDRVSRKYGVDTVAEWIVAMENKKRLKGG